MTGSVLRIFARHRIINYNYYQQKGRGFIASGAVESTVKPLDRRLKISGAQWNEENVTQVRILWKGSGQILDYSLHAEAISG